MSPRAAFTLSASLLLSCQAGTGVLGVSRVLAPSLDCSTAPDPGKAPALTHGELDLAAGAPAFFVQLQVVRNTTLPSTSSDGGDDGLTDQPVITELVAQLPPSDAGVWAPEEHLALSAPFDGSNRATLVNANLLGPQAAAALLRALPVSTGTLEAREVVVHFEVRGVMSRSKAHVSSGEVTFPLRVLRTPPPRDCGSAGLSARACSGGPCCAHVGQVAGATPSCCTADLAADGGCAW